MGQRPERLHVQLTAVVEAIEPASHEMTATVLFEQAALGHRGAGSLGHERVRVLDGPVPLRVFKLLVLVTGNTVELQQPVRETWPGRQLPGAHLVRSPIPRNDSLGPRSPR